MGYRLNAFIGQTENIETIASRYTKAKVILLTEKIVLLPMTTDLFDEINDHRFNNEIENYVFLTSDVEIEILKTINNKMISYIEVEYFGGTGLQRGIIWKNGERIFDQSGTKNVVNSILQKFGIVRSKFKDEFETAGLNRHRNTEDWLDGLS
jgi:hypothetical protein